MVLGVGPMVLGLYLMVRGSKASSTVIDKRISHRVQKMGVSALSETKKKDVHLTINLS